MGIASGMKNLVQDIVFSREDRVKTLREIGAEAKQVREEAEDLVKGSRASRKEAGVQLRKDLAQDKVNRESDIKQMRAYFRQAQDELRAELKEASVAWQGLTGQQKEKDKRRKEE